MYYPEAIILYIPAIFIITILIIAYFLQPQKTAKKRRNPQRPTASMQLQTRSKQFDETLALIDSTTNCETFFGRIEFAYQIANEQRQKVWIAYLNDKLPDMVNCFIDRSYYTECDKISALKTPKGRQNRFDKYAESMRANFTSRSEYCTHDNNEHLDSTLERMRYELLGENSAAPAQLIQTSPAKLSSAQIREIYNKAVFLVWAAYGYPVGCDYPQYLKYELNILDPKKYHNQLIKDNLLTECSGIDKLNRMKVDELKELLKKYNLPCSGKKQKLIDTLAANLSEEQLASETQHIHRLKLTDNGQAFLDLNQGFVELHKCHYDITLSDYEKVWKTGVTNFTEAAEIILKEKDSRSPMRHTKYDLANLYFETCNYQQSLTYYIQLLYYDYADEYIDDYPTYVVDRIHGMAEYYSDELVNRCYTQCGNVKLHGSKRGFAQMVRNIVATGKI